MNAWITSKVYDQNESRIEDSRVATVGPSTVGQRHSPNISPSPAAAAATWQLSGELLAAAAGGSKYVSIVGYKPIG